MQAAHGNYVLVHRKMKHWQWYRDLACKAVMLHAILEAAWKTHTWRGIEIRRGSFWAGQETLAREIGLTRQQLRTALRKLVESGEITVVATNSGSVISLCNYESYQSEVEEINQPSTSDSTNDQPAINQVCNQQKTGVSGSLSDVKGDTNQPEQPTRKRKTPRKSTSRSTTTEEGYKEGYKEEEGRGATQPDDSRSACVEAFMGRVESEGGVFVDFASQVLLREVYGRWWDYRKQDTKKPLTVNAAKVDAGRCCRLVAEEGLTPRDVRGMIERAIESGGKWQGWYFEEQVKRCQERRQAGAVVVSRPANVVDFEMNWG